MRRCGDDANCSASEAGRVEVHLSLSGRDLVHGDKLLSRRGEAHPQSFGFTGPALANCFVDAQPEVDLDFDEARPLAGVGAKQGATDAAVLMDARRRVRASARPK